MVSALYREIPQNRQAFTELYRERLAGSITSTSQRIERITSFPYALKEFVNSIADLPTIEELAAKSESLARVMKLAS